MATKSDPFNVRKRVSFNLPFPSSDEAGSDDYIGPQRHQRLRSVSEEDEEGPSPKRRRRMTEPRARAARHKGQLNFQTERDSPFPSPLLPQHPAPPESKPPNSKIRSPRLRRPTSSSPRNHPHPGRNRHGLHHRNLPQRRPLRLRLAPAENQSRGFQLGG